MKKNFQISEKDIALFVSGELSPAKEKFVQDAIDRDKNLRAYIGKLQQVDALVLKEFSEDYPIPDEFRSFVQEKLANNELSFFGRLKKSVGLISILSGSVGAGVAAALLLGMGTSQLAYRSSNEVSTFNYPQLYDWSVSEKLAVQFSIFNVDQIFEKIVVGNNSKIKIGEFFRISVLPLEDGNFELRAVDEKNKSVVVIKKTRAIKGRVLSHPVQKISGPGKHEFQFFLNEKLAKSVTLQIDD